MPRAAGNSSHYKLGLFDKNGKPVGKSIGLPSVTTILSALPKPGMEWWGYKLGTQAAASVSQKLCIHELDIEELYSLAKKTDVTPLKEMKSAGDRGTRVHNLIEQALNYETELDPKKVDPDLVGYALAFNDWRREWPEALGWVLEEAELPVFSVQHGYAGTFDALFKDPLNKSYVLVDFKTSKRVYDSHLLQLAPYASALKEMGIVPEGAYIGRYVVLIGDGEYDCVHSPYQLEDFLTVKNLWELLQRMKTAS